jgi:hypothetical protein
MNNYGELGAVTVGTQVEFPVAVQGLADGQNVAMATCGQVTCTIRKDDTVVCLGYDGDGELGRGTAVGGMSSQVAPVVGVGWPNGDTSPLRGARAIALGSDGMSSHACAIVRPACARAGSVVCWGNNTSGELGDGTMRSSDHPVRVLAPK